jgi:hypothetical protein
VRYSKLSAFSSATPVELAVSRSVSSTAAHGAYAPPLWRADATALVGCVGESPVATILIGDPDAD